MAPANAVSEPWCGALPLRRPNACSRSERNSCGAVLVIYSDTWADLASRRKSLAPRKRRQVPLQPVNSEVHQVPPNPVPCMSPLRKEKLLTTQVWLARYLISMVDSGSVHGVRNMKGAAPLPARLHGAGSRLGLGG